MQIRKIINLLWDAFLLFYSGLTFAFLIMGPLASPSLLILPFYLIVPGYVFVDIFFPKLSRLEKAVLSIGLSVALLIGIKGLVQTFKATYILSEFTILAVFSLIYFLAKLVAKVTPYKFRRS